MKIHTAAGASSVFLTLVLIFAAVPSASATISAWLQAPEDGVGENIASDVDWRDIMLPQPMAPNWTIADDFRGDGEVINGVRWWGSYFGDPTPGLIEEGFIISFFRDIPAGTGGIPHSRPDSTPTGFLGSYIAPFPSVAVTPTDMFGWDTHEIFQYEIHFDQTHFEHGSPILDETGLDTEPGEIYWISIVAENGHEIDPATWQVTDTGDPIETTHFWGWHTSRDAFNDVPTMSSLFMPTSTQWVYDPNWQPIDPEHNGTDMAFELWKVPEPSSAGFLLLAAGVAALRRRR